MTIQELKKELKSFKKGVQIKVLVDGEAKKIVDVKPLYPPNDPTQVVIVIE